MSSQNTLTLNSLSFQAMGTACHVHVYADTTVLAEDICEAAACEVERISERYSRFQDDSELSRINRVAESGGTVRLDPETASLMDYAQACYEKSDGAFDITSGILRRAWDFSSNQLPTHQVIAQQLVHVGFAKLHWDSPNLTFTVPGQELDFGGIGKEYAAVRAAEVCAAHGVRHGLVDLGGDIHIIGPHPDDDPWCIDIRHPRSTDLMLGRVELKTGGLASSGDYERCMVVENQRYGHILDPKTGHPLQGLAAVTVVASDCLVAGSLATIAMLKGAQGPAWLAQIGVDHVWMDEQGQQGGSLLN